MNLDTVYLIFEVKINFSIWYVNCSHRYLLCLRNVFDIDQELCSMLCSLNLEKYMFHIEYLHNYLQCWLNLLIPMNLKRLIFNDVFSIHLLTYIFILNFGRREDWVEEIFLHNFEIFVWVLVLPKIEHCQWKEQHELLFYKLRSIWVEWYLQLGRNRWHMWWSRSNVDCYRSSSRQFERTDLH